jgi:hypothetical protein
MARGTPAKPSRRSKHAEVSCAGQDRPQTPNGSRHAGEAVAPLETR